MDRRRSHRAAVQCWQVPLYLGQASVGSAYGAAGSLVVFLAWVYYSAQIFFLGAEFTRIYANRHGSKAKEAVEVRDTVAVAANT